MKRILVLAILLTTSLYGSMKDKFHLIYCAHQNCFDDKTKTRQEAEELYTYWQQISLTADEFKHRELFAEGYVRICRKDIWDRRAELVDEYQEAFEEGKALFAELLFFDLSEKRAEDKRDKFFLNQFLGPYYFNGSFRNEQGQIDESVSRNDRTN